VGIQVEGQLTEALTLIEQCQRDDLPSHIKKLTEFQHWRTTEHILSKDTRYYIQLPAPAGETAVEFITVEGEDVWVGLRRNPEDKNNPNYYTNIHGCLNHNNNYTGWWNITDPQHPEYQTHDVSTSAGVEILTGALHHIATLQGTNPFSTQEPILPQVKAAIQQGIEIPLHTAPAAAVFPTMTEQTNAGDTAVTASNINVIAHSNGALKGNPPFIFDGNRQLSKKFLLAFQLWRMINKSNNTIKQPYSRVIAALSYMDGPKVDSWKEEQTIRLDDEVGSGTLETDKTLWDNWMEAFLMAFTNTNRRAEAYKELCELKHKESLDSFFTDFKHLVKDADIKLDDHSTIEILKNNLKGALVQAIIRSPNYDPTSNNPWKFKE